MTIDLAKLPCPHCSLPIPEDIKPNERWSPLLIEIADHIGARLTLVLIHHFGGQNMRIPKNPELSRFSDVIGVDAAAKISFAFGGEYVFLPLGTRALSHARRQVVLAQVREGTLSAADGGRYLRAGRRYMTALIHDSGEGLGIALSPDERLPRIVNPKGRTSRNPVLRGDFDDVILGQLDANPASTVEMVLAAVEGNGGHSSKTTVRKALARLGWRLGPANAHDVTKGYYDDVIRHHYAINPNMTVSTAVAAVVRHGGSCSDWTMSKALRRLGIATAVVIQRRRAQGRFTRV